MVDESGLVTHEPRIDGALRRTKIVKTQIHAQCLPKQVDTRFNQLSSIDHDALVFLNVFSSKKA